MIQSPWAQPSYKPKRKKTKKKAKKKVARKKAKKVAKKKTKKAAPKKKAKKVVRKKAKAKAAPIDCGDYDVPAWVQKANLSTRGGRRRRYRLSPAEFKRILGRGGHYGSGGTFTYKGQLYWRGLACTNWITGNKLVLLSKWKKKYWRGSHFCSAIVPGYVRKIKGKEYVQAEFHEFVQKGSGLDK